MNHFLVQVFRCGEWRKLATIGFEPGHNPRDADQRYRAAYRAALKCISAWRGHYDDPLRIAEPAGYRDYREVRL